MNLRNRGPEAEQSALRKALATTGSGANLVPEDLEPLIRDYLWYMSPLTEAIPLVRATGHLHDVRKRTAVNRGWVEGESTEPTYSQSTYAKRQLQIKIIRTSGKVTEFMRSAAISDVDALAEEIYATTEGLADVFEYMSMYGFADDLTTYNITGDAYQYTGVYGWMLEDALSTNVLDAGSNGAAGATVTLAMLDTMFANSVGKYKNFSRDPYMWLMSQNMIDKISGLQTRIQRSVPQIEFEGGMVMNLYKNIPIMPSQFCAPGTADLGSPTATPAAGGALAADQYFYRIAAISLYGEQIADAEFNGTSTGTNATLNLAWTADDDAKLYAIYRGTTTGDDNLGLLDVIAAKTYDGTGKVTGNVAAYADAGAITSTANVQPLDSGEESIFLINLGTAYGASRVVLPPTRGELVSGNFEPANRLVRYENIPITTDEWAFRLKSYHGVQVPRGESCVVTRRAKTT
jgi:hypothetical protein